MIDWSRLFSDALPYQAFLDRYATPSQRSRWDAMHGRFSLTAEQHRHLTALVGSVVTILLGVRLIVGLIGNWLKGRRLAA